MSDIFAEVGQVVLTSLLSLAVMFLFTRIGGKQASMEYRSVSDKVDESLLEIPAGYTVCTKGEDGSLRDAAGRVVA